MALCHYCEKALATVLDHVVPKALGGAFAFWNTVPACDSCNRAKGQQWPTHDCNVCRSITLRNLSERPAIILEAVTRHAERAERGVESHRQRMNASLARAEQLRSIEALVRG